MVKIFNKKIKKRFQVQFKLSLDFYLMKARSRFVNVSTVLHLFFELSSELLLFCRKVCGSEHSA